MSRGLNRVTLIGHLGRDPETKSMPSGDAVANFSIATSEEWKDKQGEKQSRTEWHNCVSFGKLADIIGEYLRKGSQVYIEGSLRTRKWQDKEGKDRYTTEILCREMQMLGGKREGGDRSSNASSSQTSSAESDAGGALDDDIPFAAFEHGTIA